MARGPVPAPRNAADPATIRLDKWLWHARFAKTRTLAAAQVASGRVRLNGTRVVKPGHILRPGDVLTLPLGPQIAVVRVLACGTRRGPEPEARTLYADLTQGPDDLPAADPNHETSGLSGPAPLE